VKVAEGWVDERSAAECGFAPSGFFPMNFDQEFALMELDLVAVRRVDSARSPVP
jgi:hypothetical protein